MAVDPSFAETLAKLRDRRTKIEAAIRALESVISDDPDAPAPPRKTVAPSVGRAARLRAIEALLKESPEGLKPSELAAALAERGMPLRSDNPPRAARAAANRAKEQNPDIKLENGRFIYAPAQEQTPRS